MSSSLFSKIGLANIDLGLLIVILFVIVIVLIVLVIVVIVKNRKLTDTYNKFMQGKNAISLENEIQNLAKSVNVLNENSAIHAEDIEILFKKHEGAFQKMGFTKYDAFKEMGGKLSFALTLLDENDNGFLLNSVHSSTGCFSYTKRIKNGSCDLDLSNEERDSLNKALAIKWYLWKFIGILANMNIIIIYIYNSIRGTMSLS